MESRENTLSSLHEGLIRVCTSAIGQSEGTIYKGMVRLLRRSIADLTEEQLRACLRQIQVTLDDVLAGNPATIDAEIIPYPPELEAADATDDTESIATSN